MTCQELDFAKRELMMFDQKNAFPEEIENIKKGGCVKKSSCLGKLIDGLFRIGRRLAGLLYPVIQSTK